MRGERLYLFCAKECWVTRSEHRPVGWVAIVFLRKGPQESPRKKVGESKLLFDKISMLNLSLIN